MLYWNFLSWLSSAKFPQLCWFAVMLLYFLFLLWLHVLSSGFAYKNLCFSIFLTLKLQISNYSSHSWRLQGSCFTCISSEKKPRYFHSKNKIIRKHNLHGSYRVAKILLRNKNLILEIWATELSQQQQFILNAILLRKLLATLTNMWKGYNTKRFRCHSELSTSVHLFC